MQPLPTPSQLIDDERRRTCFALAAPFFLVIVPDTRETAETTETAETAETAACDAIGVTVGSGAIVGSGATVGFRRRTKKDLTP